MDRILRLLTGIVLMTVFAIRNPPLTTPVVVVIVLAGCLIITSYIKNKL